MSNKQNIIHIICFIMFLSLSLNCFGQIGATKKGKSIYYIDNYSEYQAKKYFESNAENLHPIEGIWLHDGWKYSIEKDYNGYSRDSKKFRAVVLEVPRQTLWESGDIQFFLIPGASGVFEVIYYAYIAKWTRGERDYVIEPVKGIAIQDGFSTLSIKHPEFNDHGQVTRQSVESFIKFFPDRSIVPESKEKTTLPAEWSGSGFALKNGYIVTNYHVIDGAKSIKINGVNGNFNSSYNAMVVGSDKINDLALLKISDSSFTGFESIPYSISSNTSDVGEEIFVLGYPLTSTMGEEIKLTTGIISSKTGFQGDVALYQISAPIQPGNSGGPLFDKKGNVIGIVSAKHEGAENVGYAIKTMYLRNLVESCANSSIIPNANTVSTLPLTGKVKSEKNFVFFIKCSK